MQSSDNPGEQITKQSKEESKFNAVNSFDNRKRQRYEDNPSWL